MRTLATTIADAAAAALVVIGVAQVYAPAAWIVAGVAVAAASWRASTSPATQRDAP